MPIDYAQISSTEDQRPSATTPTQITLNQNDSISGIEHSAESPGTIRIQDSGIYVIIAAPQVGRTTGFFISAVTITLSFLWITKFTI